jgi:alanine dehydrogenase
MDGMSGMDLQNRLVDVRSPLPIVFITGHGDVPMAVETMKKGAVIVDVAIDQGGCFETSKPTTHAEPCYEVDGVVHYCVANMPGAVPYTSTLALTNATLPYAVQLANKGWKKACADSNELKLGLNVINGKVVYKGVAEAFNLEYTPVDTFLN